MKKFLLALILILSLPLVSFASEITVAAAANLSPLMDELVAEFENISKDKINVVTGSSGKLTAQIENGAPFDVFLSADTKYPNTLYHEGLTIRKPRVYAYGLLVLWSTRLKDLSGMGILAEDVVKKIALANPSVAPYGRETVNALKYFKLYKLLQGKLVYGENISQTNDFVISGSADIGFTSKSTVLAPTLKEKGVWIEISPESYQPIAQAAVILNHARKSSIDAAQSFFNFLFTPEARKIFKKYGYRVDE